eukprot:TRINITY_DN207_c6_g2_i1.p2 TRINITY_DN207_c6_g2~~TRINITY_DN207_c6_g2_i1.p2  ORF type:complete len:243 (+),score=84.07 TRINITY_DN207_c6_g2_i1:71-799(+)
MGAIGGYKAEPPHKAYGRIAMTVVAIALCIAALTVDDGYFKWSCEGECIQTLYDERMCHYGVNGTNPEPCLHPSDIKQKVTSIDFHCGVFVSKVSGETKGTLDAIKDLKDAGILCDDYDNAIVVAQAFGLVSIGALCCLIVNYAVRISRPPASFDGEGILVGFLHFTATFFMIFSTAWVPIFFQVLEPCEFNYHSLQDEKGTKIGIAQFILTAATLLQFVVLFWAPGMPAPKPVEFERKPLL